MAGLELLLIDGGATVTGLAMAGAARLGYKEHKRDVQELVSLEQLAALRLRLKEEHASVEAGHRALTAIWQGPLSLFSTKQAQQAGDRGVPSWAIEAVQLAQRLVDRAAELGDMTDVYEAQLILAEQGKGALRAPVRELERRLSALGERLTLHVPVLIVAREAFEAPPAAEGVAAPSSTNRAVGGAGTVAAQVEKQEEEEQEQLPIPILRDRGSLGELWGAVDSVGQHYGEALQRSLDRLEGRREPSDEPQELSPYVLAYM